MPSTAKRINSGRGHWYKLDGTKCDGVTWVIDNGVPKKALVAWAAREVASYAADNLELLQGLDRDAAVDLLKGAPYRDRDKAARRGTEVHKIAERLARGEEVEVPDELVGHVDAYLQFREDWNPRGEIVEFTVVNRRHGYMGTGDLMATLDHKGFVMVDIKTNRSGPFDEVGLQCAAYRYAEHYIDDQGDEVPMPEVAGVYCLWLRADGYDLVPFKADETVFRTFLYAQQVARFTTADMRLRGDALEPPRRLSA